MSFWRRRAENLDGEIEDYLTRETQLNIENGMPPDRAYDAARRKLGPVLRVKEETRAAWGWMWLERLWQDLRHGYRMLAKTPGFTTVAVASLAIGIGANCAIFSVADSLILRPLPVPRASEVLSVGSALSLESVFNPLRASYPDYKDLRDRTRTFVGLAASTQFVGGLTTQPDALPKVTLGMEVSGNFLGVLGVKPELGRDFLSEEDRVPGRDAVVILDHSLWEKQFFSDRSILGKRIRLNGIEFTVIGVLPEEFTGVDGFVRPAFYVPLMMYPALSGNPRLLELRNARNLDVRGRLKPGVTIAQARAEVSALAQNLEQTYPDTNRHQKMNVRTDLEAKITQRPTNAKMLAMLGTLALAVLLVACANVTGLLSSRAPARAREMSLRLSIGAGRGRLIRQLLTESLLLAVAGGALGLGIGYAGAELFGQMRIPTDLPVSITPQLDQRALLFSFLTALTSVILFGLVPAIQTTRTDLASALKSSEAVAPGQRRLWGRSVLVTAQVAIALMLLAVTAFMYRGFRHELDQRVGFRTDHLLTASFDPSLLHYSDAQTRLFFRQLVDRAKTIPRVSGVTLGSQLPLSNDLPDRVPVVPEGYQLPAGKDNVIFQGAIVDENFFDVMGVPILRGREFRETDTSERPLVAVVNEKLAEHYWPGKDPIGKRFRMNDRNGPWVEIVGVARNAKYVWVAEAPFEYLYLPLRQHPEQQRMLLFARAGDDPAQLLPPLREIVRSLDPNQPMFNVRSMDEVVGMSVQILEIVIEAVGAMGLMGLVLALAGLYGLMSYNVSRRTREIGIRIAIGAGRGSVLKMVLRQGLTLALTGIVIGAVLSQGIAVLLRAAFPPSQGRGIDLIAYATVLPTVLAVTLLAAYLPARRASRLNPTVALRYE